MGRQELGKGPHMLCEYKVLNGPGVMNQGLIDSKIINRSATLREFLTWRLRSVLHLVYAQHILRK